MAVISKIMNSAIIKTPLIKINMQKTKIITFLVFEKNDR